MTKVRIRLDTTQMLKNGTFPLVVQLSHFRHHRTWTTPYGIRKDQWMADSESAVCTTTEKNESLFIEEVNRYLESEKQKWGRIIMNRIAVGMPFSVPDLEEDYRRNGAAGHLLTFLQMLIDEFQETGRISSSYTYKSTLMLLIRFGCSQDMLVEQITPDFLKRFFYFMQRENLSPNSVALYMRILRAAYNKAIDKELISGEKDPFRRIRIRTEKTAKRAVDRNTLRQILELDLSYRPELSFSRDIFLFSFYARGMSFVDLAYLRRSDISWPFIIYRRHKTNRKLQIRISDQLAVLIDKYRSESEFVFPILSNTYGAFYTRYKTALRRHNRNLKEIGRLVKLNVNLTSYVARHSWATIAKRSGIPTAVISEGLGHTNEKTTEIYLDSFENDVVDRANEIISLL